MADYVIERGLGVRDRMNLLATVHAPATLSLFDMLGLAQGARCIDLGCGGGQVTMELARRAGPSGSAIGMDLDEALLGAAREEAAAQGLDNLTFRVASVEHFVETGFDLAFARMLLSHLLDPAAVVGRMAGAVRHGGIVIVEDVDFAGCFTEPACAAYNRWVSWFREAVRRNNGDLDIGPRLPGLLRLAGLTNVGVRVAQPAFLDGPAKQLQQMSMEKTRAAVLAAGVASADEYDAAHTELKAFTDDPATLVASPRIIQAWGRRA
jgi:ubiquinone/menaquinone biosynthesis C-methylase UbiE